MKEYPSNDKLQSAVADFIAQLDYADIGVIRDTLGKAWWSLYSVDKNAPATKFLSDIKFSCSRAIDSKMDADAETFYAEPSVAEA